MMGPNMEIDSCGFHWHVTEAVPGDECLVCHDESDTRRPRRKKAGKRTMTTVKQRSERHRLQ